MKITAIMPTYNQRDTIEEAWASILQPNDEHVPLVDELIVVNDGSNDGTAEFLDAHAPYVKHVDVRVIHLPKNSGTPAHPINVGFAEATGDLVTWVSSDNVYYNNWRDVLEKPFLETDDVGSTYSAFELFSGQIVYRSYHEGALIGDLNCLFGMSFLIRRDVWEDAGDHKPGLNHDYDHCLRVEEAAWAKKLRIVGCPDIAGKYRQHQNRMTAKRKHPYIAKQIRDQAVARRHKK